jgi:hypothetical protein
MTSRLAHTHFPLYPPVTTILSCSGPAGARLVLHASPPLPRAMAFQLDDVHGHDVGLAALVKEPYR